MFLLTGEQLGEMEALGEPAPSSAFLQQPFSVWCPPCHLVFAGLSREVDVTDTVAREGTQEPAQKDKVILQNHQLLLLAVGTWFCRTECLLGVYKRKTKLSR